MRSSELPEGRHWKVVEKASDSEALVVKCQLGHSYDEVTECP